MSESLKQQIDRLQELYKSELDPQGRAFVPLADAHRRLGDLDKALAVIQEGLGAHPDFASAHVVLGWVHRSREEHDDARRSFERVLELDAENMVARAAIAELIEEGAVAVDDGRPVVPIGSLAPDPAPWAERPVVPIASLAPDLAPGAERPVVPIASLAPDLTPDSMRDLDGRPVVPIASLAPDDGGAAGAPDIEDGGVVPDDRPVVPDNRPVVPIPSLAPDGVDAAPAGKGSDDGEIYTQTLGELYATQGATDKAIEVYGKLIADDPDNQALRERLAELESGSRAEGPRAELDVQAGLSALGTGLDGRKTVPIESLAPDAGAGAS